MLNSWTPAIQEINLVGSSITPPEIEVSVREGSTRSLGIKQTRNPLKAAYHKLLRPIHRNNEYVFDSRYEIDTNIAHVLDNTVSAALIARKTYPKITVILRSNACAMAQTAFNLLGIPILCTDAEVFGRLILINQSGRERFLGRGMYTSLFDTSFDGYEAVTPERVFISRRHTRTLLNETEVEQVTEEYGFQKVYFEDLPLNRQWSLTRNAKAIVGIHGAALSSLVFNRNAVKVVELFHPGYIVNLYRHLTNAVGGKWCGVTGQLPPDIVRQLDYKKKARYFALEPTRIDITSLRMALEYIGI